MGEIAEMMLDGTMCEGCGVFLDHEARGYPGYCSKQCAADRGLTWDEEGQEAAPKKKKKKARNNTKKR